MRWLVVAGLAAGSMAAAPGQETSQLKNFRDSVHALEKQTGDPCHARSTRSI